MPPPNRSSLPPISGLPPIGGAFPPIGGGLAPFGAQPQQFMAPTSANFFEGENNMMVDDDFDAGVEEIMPGHKHK